MKRLVWAVLLTLPLLAQTNERTTKLVHLKYADPDRLAGVIGQFGVSVVPNGPMKVMTMSGLPAQMAAAEAAVAQLDVAPKDIELVIHFVVGSDQPNLTGSAVPAEIRDVITQLKGTFTYKDYKMMDVLTIRTRAGSSAEATGILSSGTNPRFSQFSIRNATISEDGTTIRIDRLRAGLRIPIGMREAGMSAAKQPVAKMDYMNTGIDQDVDVKEGQKVVVGRASLEGPEKALFLILTARVM